jgi:pilus assembly protein Flp/PilA
MGAGLGRFLADEAGVTAIEYGLIALLVSLVLIGAAGSTGQHLKHLLHLAAALSSKGRPGLH